MNAVTELAIPEWAPPPMLPKAFPMFEELAALPRYVGYVAVWNPKREKWDKVPHDGARKLSTTDPTHWGPMLEVIEAPTGKGLSGIGLVFTGGIEVDGETLVGFDFDGVTGPIELLEALGTYSEVSPSRTGKRAFVWVSTEMLAGYKDNTEAHLGGCAHCEIYFGSAARFLTITFHPDGEAKPIAHLAPDHPAIAELQGLLKRKGDDSEAPAPMIVGDGTPIDLDALTPGRNAEDRESIAKLLAGDGRAEGIDRDKVVNKLLVWMIDSTNPVFSQEDIFATLTQHPALWLYLLSHRNNNPEKAMQFANRELAVAFNGSTKGKLAKLFANAGWKVVEVADEVKEPDSPGPEAPDDYYMPTIGELMKKPHKPRFAVGKQFLLSSVNIMYGDSGHCKTTFLTGLAVAKAWALIDPEFKWYGMDIYDPRPQRIIAGEDSIGVEHIVRGYCKRWNIDIEKLPLRISPGAYDFSQPDEVAKVKAAAQADLEQYGLYPDFTADTLSCNSGDMDENSASEMRVLIKRFDEVRGDGSIFIPHHNGLLHKDRERGSSVIRKNPTSNNYCFLQGTEFTYTPKKQRGGRLPPPMTLRLEEVVIGDDYDGHGNVIGELVTAVLMPDSGNSRESRIRAFYARFPNLDGDRRGYMEILLLHINSRPGVKPVDLEQACDVSQSTMSRVIKELRGYDLIEPKKLRLTQLGVEGLAELTGDPNVRFQRLGNENKSHIQGS